MRNKNDSKNKSNKKKLLNDDKKAALTTTTTNTKTTTTKTTTTFPLSSSSSSSSLPRWRKVDVCLGGRHAGASTEYNDNDNEQNKKASGGEQGHHDDEHDHDYNKDFNELNYNHYDEEDDDHDDGQADEHHDSYDVLLSSNHHDDHRKRRRRKSTADSDLEAEPDEDVAIFLGLEVLDGNSYKILMKKNNNESSKEKKKEKEDDDQQENNDDDVIKGNDNPDMGTTRDEEQTNKKNKKVKKKKRKKNKRKKINNDGKEEIITTKDCTGSNEVDDNDKAAVVRVEKNIKTTKQEEKAADEDYGDDDDDISDNNNNKSNDKIVDVNNVEETIDSTVLDRMSDVWCSCTGGIILHPVIIKSLVQRNFWIPTPIQSATLSPSILGRRNIVGAAPTGSGKTLAFLIPVFQYILSTAATTTLEKDDDEDRKETEPEQERRPTRRRRRSLLSTLIVTPTRELAVQIQSECDMIMSKIAGLVVGGLAHAKQIRILQNIRPSIVIGTPGRLWEMISSGEHEHLNDLSHIRFMIIDEADRMIQQGSYPQLNNILDAVHRANPMDDDDDDDDEMAAFPASGSHNKHMKEDDDDDDEHYHRLKGLPGVRGEAHVEMLSEDILRRIQEERTKRLPQQQSQSSSKQQQQVDDVAANKEDEGHDDSKKVLGKERSIQDEDDQEELHDATAKEHEVKDAGEDIIINDHVNNWTEGVLHGNHDEVEDEDGDELEEEERVFRQTFVFSATLTLPATTTASRLSSKNRISHNVAAGAIGEILERAKAKGKTKIFDLTTTTTTTTTTSTNKKSKAAAEVNGGGYQLPPGLQLQQIRCTQRHKDSHLYAYLMTTSKERRFAGPCLVFCNSISAVRRLGETLQVLGLNARTLHANMQQRARLKAVESLRHSDKGGRVIVVATDVAARGLDIPSVSTVVHYEAARSIDTFVHRSGRTARGVGDGAVGCSLSLVSSDEDKFHAAVVRSLSTKFEDILLDGRLLAGASSRVNLATKIATTGDVERQCQRRNRWLQDKAREAGIEMDEDEMLESGLAGGDEKDRSRLREAMKAKEHLRVLLSQPLRTQQYGKFLATNGAAAAFPRKRKKTSTTTASAIKAAAGGGGKNKRAKKSKKVR